MKIRFGRYTVETSNDDKILFPDSGISKADVIRYYRDAAEWMLPHLEDRCLTIRRFPDGIGEDGFFQQHHAEHFPDFVRNVALPTAGGDGSIEHIVANNAAAIAYLANQATIEIHGWLATSDQPTHPDRIVFDLDPADDDFSSVTECAVLLKEALELSKLVPYVMTTGSRGLHVVAPLSRELDFEAARDFANTIAAATAARQPSRFTTEQRKKARGHRLYIDTARNAYGQTAVLAYSLRAIERAPVATPLDWSELDREDLSPQRYHIGNIRRRLAQKADPFADFFRHRRTPDFSRDRLDKWAASGSGS